MNYIVRLVTTLAPPVLEAPQTNAINAPNGMCVKENSVRLHVTLRDGQITTLPVRIVMLHVMNVQRELIQHVKHALQIITILAEVATTKTAICKIRIYVKDRR